MSDEVWGDRGGERCGACRDLSSTHQYNKGCEFGPRDWRPDGPRPIPPELAPEYVHADYSPTPVADSLQGVTVGQRIDVVMRERLKDMFGQVV